jgi:CheY-like chemotaxis protein
LSARRHVLVVDDEPSVANVIQRMLPEHDVVVENDAGRALARIETGERYDIVLCDVMMPVMTGMDLYESMRSSHPDMASKVVFLTGGAFSPRASEFLEKVKNEIVTKPFTAAQLRAAIGRVVASRNA